MPSESELMETAADRLPLSISIQELVTDGGDHEFRELVALLNAATGRMHSMRRELAKALGVSVAEFSVLTALMYLERKGNVRVRTVAEHLHIAAARVTTIVKRLAVSGWVIKTTDSRDSRAVSLRLTAEAQDKLTAFGPLLCAVNDQWFAGMSRPELLIASEFMRRLVRQFDSAMTKAKDMQGAMS